MRRLIDFLRSPVVRDIWMIAATVLALVAALIAVQTVDRLDRESRERRHQTCTAAERRFVQEVRSLEQTYKYFLRLSPAERRTDRIASVIRLSQVEAETLGERPASFCDEKGIGLPERNELGGSTETDPDMPKRPEELRDTP